MTCAYNKEYLPRARAAMGTMFDYAVWDVKMDIDEYFSLFVASGLADRFGNGEPSIVAGMSGVEIAREALTKTGYAEELPQPRFNLDRSREYWTGWALAYFQWASSIPFRLIARYVPVSHIRDLYSPYHEMDIRQFVDRMNELYSKAKPETNLKIMREGVGLTQARLAAAADVPVRTIQQYEQRQKNIRKANIETVLSLAHAIGCRAEDLLD